MPRRPPVVRCGCGRMHASWNPHKLCRQCVKERRSREESAAGARARERERRLLRPTPAERAEDQELRQRIHARWLARQPVDHPWRVVREEGAA